MKSSLICWLSLVALSVSAQWVSYNDHYSGPNTGPNVTAWNALDTAGGAPGNAGPLTNVMTGEMLPVGMLITNAGGPTGGGSSSGPLAGSPAALVFTNYIDWGSGGGINHAVQLSGSAVVAHVFTNLNVGRLYNYKGTAVRGNNYADRWTIVQIVAAGFTPAHTAGALTAADIPGLTPDQVVYNSGENRTNGTVISWDNIQPNADGSLVIYQTTYRGTMPPGLSSGGTYGYAMMADRLEELSGQVTAIAITNQPQSRTATEAQSVTFSVGASGSPRSYFWRKNGTVIPGAIQAAYTIPSVTLADAGTYSVIVSNSLGAVTSANATLTVVRDTNGPVLLSAIGNVVGDEVRLTFSELLDPGTGNEPSNYEILGLGGASDLLVSSVTLTNGTNVLLFTDPSTPRNPGDNYNVRVSNLLDRFNNVVAPNPSTRQIRPDVILIGFDTDNEWKYDINNGDRTGTGWENVGFNDSAWPSGPAGVGHDVEGNAVPIRTDIPYMTNGVVAYFRKHFFLPGTTNSVTLKLRDVVEDGAVYYLNGKEVLRNRMPSGVVTNGTLASGATDPTPISGPFELPITNLVSGDNVLAVEVHQSAATSTDVELAVELVANIAGFGPVAPRLNFAFNSGNNTLTLTWNAPGFRLQEATALSPNTVWSNSTRVSGAPFSVSGTGARFYRLINP